MLPIENSIQLAGVRRNVVRQAQAIDERGDRRLVGGLTRRKRQAKWLAKRIHNGVDLGAQSSTRTADGVIRAPFLRPAAC
jgi:hypothetical protein